MPNAAVSTTAPSRNQATSRRIGISASPCGPTRSSAQAPTPGQTRSTPAARNAASLVVPATATNGVPAADAIARSTVVSPT